MAAERAVDTLNPAVRPRHDIFVSYARENVQQVRVLVEILELEGYEISWDQRFHSLVPWDRQIERAIDRALLAVVVLWSRAALNSNMVREEVHRACKRKGLLLSARLEDVEPPFPHALEHALDLQNLDQESIGRLLDELDARRRRLTKRSEPPRSTPAPSSIAPRDRSFLFLRAGGVATAVLAAVFLLFGTGLIDQLFATDTKLRFVSVWARSLLLAPLPESPITYVSIGEDTIRGLGSFGAKYRSAHAAIVRGAARHGAKVVAFDVFFPPPRQLEAGVSDTEAGTVALASAIAEARAVGTAIVIGEEKPGNTESRIRDALQRGPPAFGAIATLCIGLKGGFALSAPLFVATDRGSGLEAPVSSLSLASFASFVGADASRPILSTDRNQLQMPKEATLIPLSVTISELDRVKAAEVGACAFFSARSETVATMVIDFPVASRYEPGPHVIEYVELLKRIERSGGEGDEARQAASDLDSKFKGRLVLVAPRIPNSDRHPVFGWHGGYAWGSELHAYAIETLLSGRALRIISNAAHLALIGVLGALGALVRLVYRRDRQRRRLGLLALLTLNAIGVVVAAVYFDLLVDAVYQTLAIVLMYLMCGRYVSPWSNLIAAKGSV
jgi:CHASE2 domain-containing sensor protein